MIFDRDELGLKLTEFGKCLPEMPKWIGLVDINGQSLAYVGDFSSISGDKSPAERTVALSVAKLSKSNYDVLDVLNLQNLSASIHIGHAGTLFLLNLDDRFMLGVSYHGVGEGCCYENIDETEEAIRAHSQMIMDAIYR